MSCVIQVRGKTPGDGGEDGWGRVAQEGVGEEWPPGPASNPASFLALCEVQDMYPLFHPITQRLLQKMKLISKWLSDFSGTHS